MTDFEFAMSLEHDWSTIPIMVEVTTYVHLDLKRESQLLDFESVMVYVPTFSLDMIDADAGTMGQDQLPRDLFIRLFGSDRWPRVNTFISGKICDSSDWAISY